MTFASRPHSRRRANPSRPDGPSKISPADRETHLRPRQTQQAALTGLGIFLHSQLPSAAGPAANSPKHWARSEVPDHSKTDDGRSPPACLRSTAELPRAHGRSHSGRVCRCASHKTCASSDSESSCSVSPKSSTRTEAAPVSTDVAATAMASAGNHGGSSLYRRRNPRVCHVSLSSISTHCAQAVTTDKTRSGRCSRALDSSSLTRSGDVTRDPSQNIEWPLASSASQEPGSDQSTAAQSLAKADSALSCGPVRPRSPAMRAISASKCTAADSGRRRASCARRSASSLSSALPATAAASRQVADNPMAIADATGGIAAASSAAMASSDRNSAS